jgi:hypothetical protein
MQWRMGFKQMQVESECVPTFIVCLLSMLMMLMIPSRHCRHIDIIACLSFYWLLSSLKKSFS